MSPSFKSLGYEPNTNAREFIYGISTNDHPLFGLLRVSRDISNEASACIYGRIEFVFDHPLAVIDFLNKFSVQCRNLIKKIKLLFPEDLFLGSNRLDGRFGIELNTVWYTCWRIVGSTKALQELTILFKSRGIAPTKDSKLDPRTCLDSLDQYKVFVLRAPWIKEEDEKNDGEVRIKRVQASLQLETSRKILTHGLAGRA